MGAKMSIMTQKSTLPFNGHIEIGLRLLSLLTEAYPARFSIHQLAALDYMLVHSDDLPEGPKGLHPKTPQRNGEYIVRRSELNKTLILFMSKSLVTQHYENQGLMYSATEYSASFLDTLKANYTLSLRKYATWVITNYGDMNENQLNRFMINNLDKWGGESNLHSNILKEY